jgi:bifunctional DNA-binding transcriptional regulator/antitoxin component of YhaV-PrlF toxin-antitoxin module
MGKGAVMADAEGRLVLPAEIRASPGLESGGELVLEVQDRQHRGSTRAMALRRAQAMVAAMVPAGVRLSEELIADRRAAAARDLAEGEQERARRGNG